MIRLFTWVIVFFLSIVLLVNSTCFAFLYEVKVLDKNSIAKLSDEEIIDAYINVLIELKASATFHETSGFTPEDYKKHKDLLRYYIYLKMEIEKRKLEIPNIDLQLM